MLNNKVFLAVDSGTSKIKVALLNEEGKILDLQSTDTNVIMPKSGYCEMDMNNVWLGVKDAINLLHHRNENLFKSISMVGVCAQGDGAWMLDENFQPVSNAILWNDTRSKMDYKEINKLCLKLNTTPLFTGASLSILKWLKDNKPNIYNNVHHVIHCKDWINFKLTGIIATDETDASTQFMDIYKKEYVYELLDYLNIGEKKQVFPPILNSQSTMGKTTLEIEESLNIPINTPVITGAIDVLSVALGCGLTNPKDKGSILGTTLGNYVVLDESMTKEHTDITGSILCHTQSGSYIRQLSALSGAPTLDWVRKNILGNISFDEMENLAKNVPVGSDGILFQPYIFGERAPFANGNACGSYLGIRAHHNISHLAKAAYEGFALSMYDCYENLPKSENSLFIAGGATFSDYICQTITDCMGIPSYRFLTKELGIMGIYRLMCANCGIKAETNMEVDKFIPDLNNHKQYKELYNKFLKYREFMETLWQ